MRVGADVWLAGLSVAMVSSMILQRHWPYPVFLCYLVCILIALGFVWGGLCRSTHMSMHMPMHNAYRLGFGLFWSYRDYSFQHHQTFTSADGTEEEITVEATFFGPYAGKEIGVLHIALYTLLAVAIGCLPDWIASATSLMSRRDTGCCRSRPRPQSVSQSVLLNQFANWL